MLRHVVVLAFKDGVTDEEKAGALHAMRTLPDRVPGIARWTVGLNVGFDPATHELSGGAFTGLPPRWLDFSLVADFETRDDYDAFIHHPAHIETRKETTARLVHEVYRVQFEI